MWASVRDYMWDSSDRNIQHVGHRRWCINPAMLKTGFGKFGNYFAMWCSDASRKIVPDYDFFAFPARGITPVQLLRKEPYAWSVSLNRNKYRTPTTDQIKVTVVPARLDIARARLTKEDQPLELEHVRVDDEAPAFPAAVIFRPKYVDATKAGSSFWVDITGLKKIDDTPVTIGYFVAFTQI